MPMNHNRAERMIIISNSPLHDDNDRAVGRFRCGRYPRLTFTKVTKVMDSRANR